MLNQTLCSREWVTVIVTAVGLAVLFMGQSDDRACLGIDLLKPDLSSSWSNTSDPNRGFDPQWVSYLSCFFILFFMNVFPETSIVFYLLILSSCVLLTGLNSNNGVYQRIIGSHNKTVHFWWRVPSIFCKEAQEHSVTLFLFFMGEKFEVQ